MTLLTKGNSMAKEEKCHFSSREKESLLFYIWPQLSVNLYLRQTGNIARSRRSIRTAGRFPGSRSANIRSRCQMTDRRQEPGGQGLGEMVSYQRRVQNSAPDQPEVKVKPGQGAGAEGLFTAMAPAPAEKQHRASWQCWKTPLALPISADPQTHVLVLGQMSTRKMRGKRNKVVLRSLSYMEILDTQATISEKVRLITYKKTFQGRLCSMETAKQHFCLSVCPKSRHRDTSLSAEEHHLIGHFIFSTLMENLGQHFNFRSNTFCICVLRY